MNYKTLTKLDERYWQDMKRKTKGGKINKRKHRTHTFTFLMFLQTRNYPLTDNPQIYMNEYKEYCKNKYKPGYTKEKIRHTYKFIEWYEQYIETLLYTQEMIK